MIKGNNNVTRIFILMPLNEQKDVTTFNPRVFSAFQKSFTKNI